MKAAKVPDNESQRLHALRSLQVLDSPAEQSFDDLTSLASQVCGTPIALVSLVDEGRQWFKSKVGLTATETSRDVSFCAHAINQNQLFEVPNAMEDVGFSDNPIVTGDPKVIFYAGVPLIMRDGNTLGTLCVIDHEPRSLTPEQRRALSILARQTAYLFELKAQAIALTEREQVLTDVLGQVEAIQRNQEAVFETMTEGLVVHGPTGEIIHHNRSALEILGLSADELTGRTPIDSRWRAVKEDGTPFPGEEHPAMVSLRTGKKLRNILMGVHLPEGSLRWININATPVLSHDAKSPGRVLATFVDVTEERENNLRLFHAARMSSLGVMSAGIAHEINTPLATIKARADLLLARIGSVGFDTNILRDGLSKITSTVDKLSGIIQSMKSVARDSRNDNFHIASVSEIVHDTLAVSQRRIQDRGVELKLSIQDQMIECRSGEIAQVLLNLLNNSLDAIEALPEKWISIDAQTEGDMVFLRVTDSGAGISEKVADRIMEPFFTTKPAGQGTGLGLSLSRRIAADHGGSLSYDSKNPNTSFVFSIPLVRGGR